MCIRDRVTSLHALHRDSILPVSLFFSTTHGSDPMKLTIVLVSCSGCSTRETAQQTPCRWSLHACRSGYSVLWRKAPPGLRLVSCTHSSLTVGATFITRSTRSAASSVSYTHLTLPT